MSDSLDPAVARVPEPDPRFRQFPIPDTVDEVVARIVEFVQHGVDDHGGPAFRFNVNAAEADFKDIWGKFVGYQLKRHPQNPWPDQWKNIVFIARKHAEFAVKFAKDGGRSQVSPEDFVKGGKEAAQVCLQLFGRVKFRGCWCNDC